jgi:hypothetical protein
MTVKTGDQVRVSKTTGRGFPIKLEPHVFTTELPALSKAERLPQDIRRWMARVWDDKELEQWFYEHKVDDADPGKPIPFTRPDTTTPAIVEILADRIKMKPNAKDAKLPDTLDQVLGKLHTRNGKHK